MAPLEIVRRRRKTRTLNQFPKGHWAVQRGPLAVAKRQPLLHDMTHVPLLLPGGRINQSRRSAAPGDKNLPSNRDVTPDVVKIGFGAGR